MAAVIRFLPDTLSDALLRPIAMAAPDAGVYVEIMAPDARFAFIAALVLIWVALAWRRKWRVSPVMALLIFVSAEFAVWLVTSGNGRYFVPVLLAAGPLCIALMHRWPSTKGFSGVVAAGVVGVQAFIVYQNNPWHSWQLAPWSNAPFFEVILDEEALTQPATYVTATSISYSLIAPKFPTASRWVNISSQPDPDNSADGRRVQGLLAASKSVRLLIPSVPDHVTSMGYPSEQIVKVINGMLAGQRLALQEATKCRLLPSKGLASRAFREVAAIKPETLAKFGFWVCPLQYPVSRERPVVIEGDPRINRTFEAIEKACPRLFPSGEALTSRADGGFMRGYSSADMKLYVFDDGSVFYKYWRAINPTLIGTGDAVLAEGFKMDCNAIRGRSGLPWNRQL
jgi:hypothetical protein